jgi:hypothetical protein
MKNSHRLFIFFISPIYALYFSVKEYQHKPDGLFIVLFCGFLGYSFHINPVSDLDANRYIEVFYEYCQGGNQFEITSFFYTLWQDPDHLEITSKLLSYLISFISSDYHVLFALMGLLYGFFLNLNLSQFKYYSDSRCLSKNFVIILLFILPPWLINGFDFWMATQIFIAGLFALLNKKYLKSVFFFLFAAITHWSFVIFILFYVLFSRIRNKNILLFLFLISFITKYFTDLEIIEKVLYKIELVNVALKAQVYLEGGVILPGGKIYGLFLLMHRLTSLLLFCYLFIKYKSKENSNLSRLLKTTIIIITISNFIAVVPILGRFSSISLYLIQFTFAVFLTGNLDLRWNNIKIKNVRSWIVYFTLFIIMIDFVYNGFLVIGILSIFSNPLIVFFIKNIDFVIGNVYGHLLNWLASF